MLKPSGPQPCPVCKRSVRGVLDEQGRFLPVTNDSHESSCPNFVGRGELVPVGATRHSRSMSPAQSPAPCDHDVTDPSAMVAIAGVIDGEPAQGPYRWCSICGALHWIPAD